MKIQKITPFLVDRFLLVRVYTDQGLIGNGEAGLWAHHGMVHRAILDLSHYYIGKDASRIEHHYQTVSRDTHFMGAALSAALSAIDVALWDIAGQAVGQPVHQLLGGRVRDKIKVFANVNGATVDECAAAPKSKLGPAISLCACRLHARLRAQDTVQCDWRCHRHGRLCTRSRRYNIDLGLEIHRNLRPRRRSPCPANCFLFAYSTTKTHWLRRVWRRWSTLQKPVPLPMATGERFYNIFQFKDLIDRKIVSLIRPDLSLAGGFTQVRKIAAIAESAFVGIFPHLMGSPVTLPPSASSTHRYPTTS